MAPWLLMVACQPVCPDPDDVGDVTFDAFATPMEIEVINPDAFPAASSPANGPLEFQVAWTGSPMDNDVTVDMNGQSSVSGSGRFEERECTHARISWAGTFEGPTGVRHTYTAAGDFIIYGGERATDSLTGVFTWFEDWTAGDAQGSYEAEVALQGVAQP